MAIMKKGPKTGPGKASKPGVKKTSTVNVKSKDYLKGYMAGADEARRLERTISKWPGRAKNEANSSVQGGTNKGTASYRSGYALGVQAGYGAARARRVKRKRGD